MRYDQPCSVSLPFANWRVSAVRKREPILWGSNPNIELLNKPGMVERPHQQPVAMSIDIRLHDKSETYLLATISYFLVFGLVSEQGSIMPGRAADPRSDPSESEAPKLSSKSGMFRACPPGCSPATLQPLPALNPSSPGSSLLQRAPNRQAQKPD